MCFGALVLVYRTKLNYLIVLVMFESWDTCIFKSAVVVGEVFEGKISLE